MDWNNHSNLAGRHALLSPSQYSWINYDMDSPDIDEVIFRRYKGQYSTTIGTLLHEYAEKRIRYKLKLHKGSKDDVLMYLLDAGVPQSVIDMDVIFDNMMNYVNDGIGFRMEPEIVLAYSENCFGTTDTICFRKNELRIHDYKSGMIQAHMEQLEIYAALFCLEYKIKPRDISTILQIYQFGEKVREDPEPELIEDRMRKIVEEDKRISAIKAEDRL